MDKLKPCPFCGGEAEYDGGPCIDYYGHEHQDAEILCKKCGAQVYVDVHSSGDIPCSCCHDAPGIAAERWNCRAQSPWIRCSERLPTEADADCESKVWVCDSTGFMIRCHWKKLAYYQDSDPWPYWKPTNLERPQPPEV